MAAAAVPLRTNPMARGSRPPSPGVLEAGLPDPTPPRFRDVNWRQSEQAKAYLRFALESMQAETFIAGLVVAYLALTVVESSLDDGDRDSLETELFAVDIIILSVFVVEISLKTYAFGWVFLRDYWNALDAVLISLSFVMQLVLLFTAEEEDSWVSRVARLRAVFRVFRILIVVNRIKRPQQLVVEMWRPHVDVRADISSPVGKVLAVLQDVRSNATLSQTAVDELDWVMHVIQTRRLNTLEREHKTKAAAPVDADAETEQWLAQQFQAHGGGGRGGDAGQRPALRRASQSPGSGGSGSTLLPPNDDPQNGVTASSHPVRRRGSTLTPKAIAGGGAMQVKADSYVPVGHLSPQELQHISSTIDAWDFDMFRVAQLTNGHPLSLTFFLLFRSHNLFARFNIAESVLSNFASAIENGYRVDNPYHNRIHAADVLQGIHHFLTFGTLRSVLTDLDVLAAMVAAGIHDYEHPGLNNAFQIATQSHVATVYNDRSVLESHHVAASFEVMQREGHGIFGTVTPEQYKEVRETVIVMVLATDMGHHFAEVAAFKEQVLSEGSSVDPSKVEERRVLLKMALHCADVSNPARPLPLYRQWTAMVMEEFHAQGDVERSLSLKVSPFMDRTKPQIAKCQVGFIKIIVAPLYDAWTDFLFEAKAACSGHLETNLAHFTAIKEREEAQAAAAEAAGASEEEAASAAAAAAAAASTALDNEEAAAKAALEKDYAPAVDTARDDDE